MGLFSKKDENWYITTGKLRGINYYDDNFNRLVPLGQTLTFHGRFIEEPSHFLDDPRNNVVVCVGDMRVGYPDNEMKEWYHGCPRKQTVVYVTMCHEEFHPITGIDYKYGSVTVYFK